jgi:diguanylate cyclase (GGDEF)-like protein
LLFSWLQDRSVTALALWGVALMCVSIGGALVVMQQPVIALSVYVGPALVLSGYGLMWCGARTFEGRTVPYAAAFLGALLWLVACQFDAFVQSQALRMRAASVLIVIYSLLVAGEYWRARDKELMSRWPAIVLMLVHAGCFFARIFLVEVLPFPAGISMDSIPWFPAGALVMLLHNFCMAFLIVNMAKERSELRQRRTAQLDPLTGVANRRAFMERGERLLARTTAQGQSAAVLLLDLDLFKQINDTFGHQTGDRVLCTFCDIANGVLRPTDVFGRLGGEEFVCLLPGATAAEALQVAERIRASFEGRDAVASARDVVSTVSVGVATTQDAGADLTALMVAAVRALYLAKAKGRNRVERAAAVTAPAFVAA